jgi:RimJ/RimL family protein N-acetyltransferase
MFEFGDIRLRPMEKDDLKYLHAWENDYELIMYSRSRPINVLSMTQIERQYEEKMKDEKNIYFIVELRSSHEPIGIATIRREEWGEIKAANIGTYIGRKDLWGKGFGRQITVALLEICFMNLNVERCEAYSVSFNERAHKTLEICGFKRSGVIRCSAFVNGKRWDSYFFDLLREEYLKQRGELLKQVLGDKLKEYQEKHCKLENIIPRD